MEEDIVGRRPPFASEIQFLKYIKSLVVRCARVWDSCQSCVAQCCVLRPRDAGLWEWETRAVSGPATSGTPRTSPTPSVTLVSGTTTSTSLMITIILTCSRLMASAITAIFSLSLLFFLIYRLRQRKLRSRQNHLEAEGYSQEEVMEEHSGQCLQLESLKPQDRVMLTRPFPPSYNEAMFGSASISAAEHLGWKLFLYLFSSHSFLQKQRVILLLTTLSVKIPWSPPPTQWLLLEDLFCQQ